MILFPKVLAEVGFTDAECNSVCKRATKSCKFGGNQWALKCLRQELSPDCESFTSSLIRDKRRLKVESRSAVEMKRSLNFVTIAKRSSMKVYD
jgi:hypothetical protein